MIVVSILLVLGVCGLVFKVVLEREQDRVAHPDPETGRITLFEGAEEEFDHEPVAGPRVRPTTPSMRISGSDATRRLGDLQARFEAGDLSRADYDLARTEIFDAL